MHLRVTAVTDNGDWFYLSAGAGLTNTGRIHLAHTDVVHHPAAAHQGSPAVTSA